MKSLNSSLLLGVALALSGCSTSTPPPRIVTVIHPPPLDFRHIPRRDDVIVGKVCQLGTSCLDLDPRPFEMCLLATTPSCGDKVTESLLAENPTVAPR